MRISNLYLRFLVHLWDQHSEHCQKTIWYTKKSNTYFFRCFRDDRPWLSRSNLTWKSNFISFWACPHHNSSAVQARITKYGQKIHLGTVKIPINFGLDWIDLHFHFQSWNLFYFLLPNLLYPPLQRSILVSPCPSVDRIVSTLYL